MDTQELYSRGVAVRKQIFGARRSRSAWARSANSARRCRT